MNANDKIEIIGEPVRLTLKGSPARTIERVLVRVTTCTPKGGTLGLTVGRERVIFGIAHRRDANDEWRLRMPYATRVAAEKQLATASYP